VPWKQFVLAARRRIRAACELTTQHPSIAADPRLARFATAAATGAQRAAEAIARLQRIVGLEEETTVLFDRPVLDLDRSTALGDAAGAHEPAMAR
jgi:hypothetical protein